MISSDALISDYSAGTPVSIAISDAQGAKFLSFRDKTPVKDGASDVWTLDLDISMEAAKRIIDNTTANPPPVTRVMSAKAEIRPTIEKQIQFSNFALVVSPVNFASIEEAKGATYFGSPTASTSSSLLAVPANVLLSDVGAG